MLDAIVLLSPLLWDQHVLYLSRVFLQVFRNVHIVAVVSSMEIVVYSFNSIQRSTKQFLRYFTFIKVFDIIAQNLKR